VRSWRSSKRNKEAASDRHIASKFYSCGISSITSHEENLLERINMSSPERNEIVTSTGQSERSVVSNIGGHDYQLVSDDDYLNRVAGKFEPDTVRLFETLINPNDTVFDIGANIGCTSILFGSRAKRVFSFEPSPTTFQYLKKNILSAKLNNVTVVNAGIGAAPGSFELTSSPNNRAGGFVSNHMSASKDHRIERIEIIKGDDFVAANAIQRVDFVKIDVEGFERFVIEGLAGTIARDKPVVTLELNHWCLNAFQRMSVPDFFDFLRKVFPCLYAVDNESRDVKNLHDRNDSYHVMYKHIVFGFKYSNLVGAANKHQLQRFSEAFGIRIS